MESRIRGDDNMKNEDDEFIPDINNSDTNSPDHAMNNQSFKQSDTSPQLSPRRKQSQTVTDQSEMHPITNKKRCRSKKSNDKEQQSHSKFYKKLKNKIKEVRKDLSTLTSIVSRMDDTIKKQSFELSEMKQMLERLVQEIQENDQPVTLAEIEKENEQERPKQQIEIQKNDETVTLVENEPVMEKESSTINLESLLEINEQQRPMKRRKLCKIADKKVPDQDQQVNPPTTSTEIISEPTIPVPDVEINDVDRYDPMLQVDPKLWKAYL
ncbi:hypothetical protein E5676_scaffold70G00150 [Cucumis melo var. makuwa]|uniref:Ulp1-like peptidase n=1 Tax=Cucumis melo var. makuwa TaxID=1194695 RepID=A0A5D3C806_CUCMM|nr:hypothetical protein E5676_scaffold70G00150 [Cucumis melo var. makuwa]